MQKSIEQIVIEHVRRKDGSVVWDWAAYGVMESIITGEAATLSACIDDMSAAVKRYLDES